MAKKMPDNWNDVKAICERAEMIWNSPARRLSEEAIEKYMDYYHTKCATSKEMTDKAKKLIPGGVQHNLSLNYPFPLAMDRAEGAYMWDVDGNRYIDFLQAGGPTVLGSNYKLVRDKVLELIETKGPVTGLFSEYEYKLADLINRHMPSVEMFRMLASGTEADMAAIRIARAYTGAKKVIKIGGAYHGWSDALVYDIRAAGSRDAYAFGIPEESYMHTQAAPVNDLDAVRDLLVKNKKEGGTACIIVEPIGPESGTRPVEFSFNAGLRELCDEFETLLIFDEVVTAFRIGMGGAQELFGVKPDITVFGKALTGGYPASGGVGGRRDLISLLAGGIGGTGRKVMVGGTLSANPLSCLAGYYTLLETERTDACNKATAAGDRLTKGIKELIDKYELPFSVFSQYSIVHFDAIGNINITFTKENAASINAKMPERNKLFNELGMALMAEGIVTIAASRMYTSLADTDDVIDDAIARFDSLLANYK